MQVCVGPWLYVCECVCRCVWVHGSMGVTVCVLHACEVSVRLLVSWKISRLPRRVLKQSGVLSRARGAGGWPQA